MDRAVMGCLNAKLLFQDSINKALNWIQENEVKSNKVLDYIDELYFWHMFLNIDKKNLFSIREFGSLRIKYMLNEAQKINYEFQYDEKSIKARYDNCIKFDLMIGIAYLMEFYDIDNKKLKDDIREILNRFGACIFGFAEGYDFMFKFFLKELGIEQPHNYSNLYIYPNYECERIQKAYIATHYIIAGTKFLSLDIEDYIYDKDSIKLSEKLMVSEIGWALENDYGDLIGEFLLSLLSMKSSEKYEIETEDMKDYLINSQLAEGNWKFKTYSERENRHATFSIVLALSMDMIAFMEEYSCA